MCIRDRDIGDTLLEAMFPTTASGETRSKIARAYSFRLLPVIACANSVLCSIMALHLLKAEGNAMPAGRAAIAPVVQGGLRPGGQVEHSDTMPVPPVLGRKKS